MAKDKEIGKRYRKLRATLDYTDKDDKPCSQDKLAGMLGFSKTQISELENGKRKPTATELTRYHEVFGVPTDYLLGYIDNEKYENIAIGQKIGLSDETIRQLEIWKGKFKRDNLVKVINCIFESGYAEQIFKTLAIYLFSEPQYFYPKARTKKEAEIQNRYLRDLDEKEVEYDKNGNEIPKHATNIQIIGTGGMQTTLYIDDLPQLFEKALLEKLNAMRDELKKNNKIPNIGIDTTWSINMHVNYIKKEWRQNGKRTTKKKQRG